MKILSVNAGSSSMKFSVFKMPEEEMLINGYIQKIGMEDSFYYIKINGEKKIFEEVINNHEDAVSIIVKELKNFNIINDISEIDGVGHRVVHGGEKYSESIIIDNDVLQTIEDLSSLAPLHNPANVTGIKAFMNMLPEVTNIAVFDTAFHQTMPKANYLYPVPYEWYTDYGVRKYGFHGTSHRYIYNRACEKMNKEELKVISVHLGNGCSICAIDKGISIDTSMGLTPLPGLMMGTRSGDIDPSIIEFMMNKKDMSIEEIMNALNKKSGLLGVSGISSDDRDVTAAELEGNERAILAHEMYSKRIADYIASYNNLLEGADVICLAGGIGENEPLMREKIMNKIKSLGIIFDKEENDSRQGGGSGEPCITKKESKVAAYVIETDEEIMIARDTYLFTK